MSLTKWYREDWVDLGSPKKGGGFEKCGRPSAKKGKRAYPKCVPKSRSKTLTAKQIKSAVRRKRAAPNRGGKPSYVPTLKKKG